MIRSSRKFLMISAGLVASTLTLSISADVSAQESVTASLSVRPAVTQSGETLLVVTLANTTDLAAHSGISVTVTLPPGVSFPVTESRTTCADVLATAPSGRFIQFEAALRRGVDSCEFTVGIKGDSPGLHELTPRAITRIRGAVRGRDTAAFVVGYERIPLSLAVTATPDSTLLNAPGRTIVIDSAATDSGGRIDVRVRCSLPSRMGRGDVTACHHVVNSKGQVTLILATSHPMTVTVKVIARPIGAAAAVRSASRPWTRTWATGRAPG